MNVAVRASPWQHVNGISGCPMETQRASLLPRRGSVTSARSAVGGLARLNLARGRGTASRLRRHL